MDVLLTHGYFLADDPREQRIMRPYPPLGILYISAYLKSRGFAPEVYDGTFSSFEDFSAYLARERPPVVGIYANLMTRPAVLRQIRVCSAHGARVVVGGPEPANYVEEYLAHGADAVVIGEGERTLEELLPALRSGAPEQLRTVAGIAYRDDAGSVVRNRPRDFIERLDDLPFPDRDAVDLDRYMNVWREHNGLGPVSLITARGCPYRCNWCSHAVYGFSHRRRSPVNVADEVEHILRRYDPDMLWYADDVFTIKPSWFYAYAAELKHRKIHIPFETISREDRLDEVIIRTLAEMGCIRIWIGSESGSQRILDAMERRTDAGRVPQLVRLLQRYGIEAGLFMMLGYEGEAWKDIDASVALLKRAPPDQFLTTTAYPIKGTGYYDRVADRVFSRSSWQEGSDRDHSVAGRHSRRFYDHAHRWMVHELNWYREWSTEKPHYLRLATSFAKAKLFRTGMWATRWEAESLR